MLVSPWQFWILSSFLIIVSREMKKWHLIGVLKDILFKSEVMFFIYLTVICVSF